MPVSQNNSHWFDIVPINDYLLCIREKLSAIEPRFHTTYTNLFLIIGSNAALLIDTGSGVRPLKPLLQEYIQDKELIIVNTHSDFDHIGGNHEFNIVYIHKNEAAQLKHPFKYNFLNQELMVRPTSNVNPLNGKEIFNLGKLKVRWIHTPGHSPGSICLYTDRGDLFTGDFLHYGAVFLPSRQIIPTVFESINSLENLISLNNIKKMYPAHEEYITGLSLLMEYKTALEKIENLWVEKIPDEYNNGWVIDLAKFKYIIGVGKKERKEFRSLLKKHV